MATWRVDSAASSQWAPSTVYGVGARVVCRTAYGTVARRGYVYECTTGGTSHGSTEPTWPTSGTVNDNDVVWTTRIPSDGSWDNASCILHYVLNHGPSIAAGDTVYVDDGHSESVTISATVSYGILGTLTKNNPIKIVCVDKADDTLSTGASIADTQTSATYPMLIDNHLYIYGLTITSATDIHVKDLAILESCTVVISSGNFMSISNTAANELTLVNTNVTFADATAYIRAYTSVGGSLIWRGGTVTAASGVTSFLVGGTGADMNATISNVDLSAVGNNTLVDHEGASSSDVTFTRCKLPASFTLTDSNVKYFNKVTLHHCSSDNAAYDFLEESYGGTTRDETTIVRTGGASDGTTPLSMKMVSSADTKEQFIWLESPTINTWTTSAASQTVTVEFVHDSATALQNDEIWLEVEYPADNTSGLGAIATSRCAILGTPADTTDSSETWTTTGLTNPNTRKLAVTIDPGKVGPITARVCLAKASTTCYIDPMITIT